jgi:glucuronate isomerase
MPASEPTTQAAAPAFPGAFPAAFMDQDFLLDTAVARALYHEHAAALPIVDYHCHLVPRELADRKRFRNITELWLGADHYKWRLMRSAGLPESLITGEAADRDKFLAFCSVLPLAIGNPLYHFCHLELRRLFDCDTIISGSTAPLLWDQLNARLSALDAWSLLARARVEVVCTTDDPADDLQPHRALAQSALATRVLPSLRPDQAMRIGHPDFLPYLDALGERAALPIRSFAALVEALAGRIAWFKAHGARLTDHAVDLPLPAPLPTRAELEALLSRRLRGEALDAGEQARYAAGFLRAVAPLYHQHGLAMCLHIGAQRNNSQRALRLLGPDSGHDAISEQPLGPGLRQLLDELHAADALPRTVLFCSHPGHYEVLATLLAAFQDHSCAGKLQLGPAWWFNDHRDGNLRQLRALASYGLLGTFIGMVTDSRSLASYPRHEYFRRLLCRQLGRWVHDGEYPHDPATLGQLVRAICYGNAKRYFDL